MILMNSIIHRFFYVNVQNDDVSYDANGYNHCRDFYDFYGVHNFYSKSHPLVYLKAQELLSMYFIDVNY